MEVGTTLAEVVRALEPIAADLGIGLCLELDDELPATTGDRDRLKQVWTNLLDNAIKFSKAGGTVRAVARRAGGSLVVEVIDHGGGIHPAHREKIFERFHQVGDSLIDKPRGSGLGLAISRAIIKHHGGEMTVESQLGRGSTFRVELPVTIA